MRADVLVSLQGEGLRFQEIVRLSPCTRLSGLTSNSHHANLLCMTSAVELLHRIDTNTSASRPTTLIKVRPASLNLPAVAWASASAAPEAEPTSFV